MKSETRLEAGNPEEGALKRGKPGGREDKEDVLLSDLRFFFKVLLVMREDSVDQVFESFITGFMAVLLCTEELIKIVLLAYKPAFHKCLK